MWRHLCTHAGPVLQSQAAPPQAQHATAPGHCCGGFVVGSQQTLLLGPHARHVPPAAVKASTAKLLLLLLLPLLLWLALLLLMLLLSSHFGSESTSSQHSPSASRMCSRAHCFSPRAAFRLPPRVRGACVAGGHRYAYYLQLVRLSVPVES